MDKPTTAQGAQTLVWLHDTGVYMHPLRFLWYVLSLNQAHKSLGLSFNSSIPKDYRY